MILHTGGTMLFRMEIAVLFAVVMTASASAGIPTAPTISPTIDACDSSIHNTEAEDVYVVFSNHLDIGYDIVGQGNFGYTAEIINTYMNKYFPLAIETAQQFLNNQKDVEAGHTYTWMGFPYLFDVFFNCNSTTVNIKPGSPSNLLCPSEDTISTVEKAIRMGPAGGITWQAFPHNAEPELYTPELFEVALNLTKSLSDRFERAPRITYSQRDVPGLTRNVLPLLAKNGIKAISIGMNGSPRAIAVRPEEQEMKWPSTRVFKWVDPISNASAITVLHPHGYGGIHACDGAYVKAAKTALYTAWNEDNVGPHTYYEAKQILEQVQQMNPNARVHTSDGFDDFIRKIAPFEDTLFVVDHEIGDSWIFGASADPIKASAYRAAVRARDRCVLDGTWSSAGLAERTFDRLIIKLGEHTWGTSGSDCKSLPFDNPSFMASGAYPSRAGAMKLNGSSFDPYCINTWYEQRMYVLNAIRALKDANSACYPTMEAEMVEISPSWEEGLWTINHHTKVGFRKESSNEVRTSSGLTISFNSAGGIVGLSDKASNGASLVSTKNPLAQFSYQIVSANDTRAWVAAYGDFGGLADYGNLGTDGKELVNGTSIGATGYLCSATVSGIWSHQLPNHGGTQILVELAMPEKAYTEGGSPRLLSVMYKVTPLFGTISGYTVDIELHTIDKTPSKHKETAWFSFKPIFSSSTSLEIDKLGAWLDPTDIIPVNGSNVHMHAVNSGVRWNHQKNPSILVESIDSPVISVGHANPVPTSSINGNYLYGGVSLKPNPERGVHFSLFNNIWNTNYPYWYPWQDEDASTQYRFRMTMHL